MKKSPTSLASTYRKTCNALKDRSFLLWPKKTQAQALAEPNSEGWTPLHFLAYTISSRSEVMINDLPEDLLTEENMLQGNLAGQTPLHMAADCGNLSQLPKALLTEKNLLTPNAAHLTPLHYAARHGHLDQIPAKVFSEGSLRRLLTEKKTSAPLKKWISQQLRQLELQKSLQNATHPDL
jgi:hypothetical protein